MKKRENFLVGQYKKCYEFLRESSDYVIIALGIFCVFIIIGFAFPIFFTDKIFEFMRELLLQIEGLNVWQMIGFIFFNNLQAAFFSILIGVLFGVFPIGTALVNGYLLGFVSRYAVEEAGNLFVLWRLLPHGIFELPAVILSVGLGIKIGIEIWKKDSIKVLKRNFKESMRFFVFVVFPLLLIAGIIEGVLIILSS